MPVCLSLCCAGEKRGGWVLVKQDLITMTASTRAQEPKWQSDAFYEVGNWEQGKGLAETTKCKKLMKQQHL